MKKAIQVLFIVLLVSLIFYMPFLIYLEVATISQLVKTLLLLIAINTALHVL